MKHKLEVLGETILLNNVIHVGRINQENNKWFFNVLFISGVGISLISDNEDEENVGMHLIVTSSVRVQQRTNQKHSGARGTHKVGQDSAA